jgi:hypothetical protein
MTNNTGWQADPYGVHEQRFFDRFGRPTRRVRDNGVEMYDAIPTGDNPQTMTVGTVTPSETHEIADGATAGPSGMMLSPTPPPPDLPPPPTASVPMSQESNVQEWEQLTTNKSTDAPNGNRKGHSTARLLAVGAFFVLLLAVIGGFWANDVGVRSNLSASRHQLFNAKSQLSATTSQLSATTSHLSAAESQLSNTKSQLQASQANVNSLQSSLTGSQNTVNYAAGVISVVSTCLSGVDETLSDDLNGDALAGTVVLESVESTCQQANSDISAIESSG